MEVTLLSGCENDVLKIYRRLDDQVPGLGGNFYSDFLKACETLFQHPAIGTNYLYGFRRYLLPKWSEGIFYTITGNRVLIGAVADVRQSPDTIRRILKELH